MRIGIDARFLTHPQVGGFKTYSENLILALSEIDSENEYILYVDRPPNQKTRLPKRSNFKVHIVPSNLPLIGMPWREQISLSRQVNRDRLDIFHSPCLTAPLRAPCPLVVTLHDMIWFFSNEFARKKPWSAHRKVMDMYYRFVPERAARNAAAVLTVSQAAKESIVRHLGLPDEKIFITYEAANSIYRQVGEEQIEAVRQKYMLNSEFILAIGSADPRKNISTLVQAYSLLPVALQQRFQLVNVWTHQFLAPELKKQIEVLGLGDRVTFLQQVSDENLALLYNAASLFVFPSRYEGFGLPLLEAMSCGTPVIAANNSSIPEVTGDAALLFAADDVEAMARQMSQLLIDCKLQKSLIEKGLERASGFSWMNCGHQTLKVYERIHSAQNERLTKIF